MREEQKAALSLLNWQGHDRELNAEFSVTCYKVAKIDSRGSLTSQSHRGAASAQQRSQESQRLREGN
jgi:hypothetical protein